LQLTAYTAQWHASEHAMSGLVKPNVAGRRYNVYDVVLFTANGVAFDGGFRPAMLK
jgi:hypothetical protein